MCNCVKCVNVHFSDLTESVIPRWMFETGAVFLHGYDKEGNKLCMSMFLKFIIFVCPHLPLTGKISVLLMI